MRFQWLETHYPPKKVTWAAEGSEGEGEPQGTVVLGDSRDAMALLAPNSVQCVYMDPPYNMGFDWGHYDDKYEYDQWLSMLKPIVNRVWSALKSSGSMWVSIDDRSFAILRIFLDQLLPGSFVATCVWQKRSTRENRGAIGDSHEYILVYAKNPQEFGRTRNVLPLTDAQIRAYKNPNNDPKGRWKTTSLTAQNIINGRHNQMYKILSPSGKEFSPPPGRCWIYLQDTYNQLLEEGRIYFGKDGNGAPTEIRYLSEVEGVVPWTWWPYDECGTTAEARKEVLALFGHEFIFPTPKPEKLLERIIAIASNPGDLVVDPFAGSGTTAAVASKMGRRFFTSELSDETFRDYVVERLRKVGASFTQGRVQTTDIGGVNDFDHVFA